MAHKGAINADKILTVIGSGTAITGTLHGSASVRIDGMVEGEINIDNDIIISKGAVIKAKIQGHNIQVAGNVIGNVEAAGKLDIMADGIVEGDVIVKTLQIANGATLTGSCSMWHLQK